MTLRIQNNALVDLPAKHTILFLARIIMRGTPCFCAVYAPTPLARHGPLEAAKVAIFLERDGRAITVDQAVNGERFSGGGGMVQVPIEHSQKVVRWFPRNNDGGSTEFLGTRIRPENILVAR